MCKVKCAIKNGLIEAEKFAYIKTSEGHTEEVTVSSRDVHNDNAISTGLIHRDLRAGKVLVELPRESASGHWRLWVNDTELVGA